MSNRLNIKLKKKYITIRKTYGYRLYVNSSTNKTLNNLLDICCWLYNLALSLKEVTFKVTGKSPTAYEIQRNLKHIEQLNPLLQDIYSHVKQTVLARVDHAYSLFFKGLKDGRKVGKPKFKYNSTYNSFTYKEAGSGFWLLDFDKNGNKSNGNWKWLKIALANRKYLWLKVKYHRDIEGKVKTCTIKRNNLGQWFVSFSVEQRIRVQEVDKSKSIGIDLGTKNLITTSINEIVANPLNLESLKERTIKIKEVQQELQKVRDLIKKVKSFKTKNKEERSNIKKKLKKLYRIYNSRLRCLRKCWLKYSNFKKDYLFKEANRLSEKYDILCIEDFKPKKLTEKDSGTVKFLRKRLRQASCTMFKNMLVAKINMLGKKTILVPPFNTTKQCSKCLKLKSMKLEDRTFSCKCGNVLDRDHNAAINIERKGLKKLGLNKVS